MWLVLMVVVIFHPSRPLWGHRIKEAFRKARLGDCVDPEVARAVDQAFNPVYVSSTRPGFLQDNHQRPRSDD